MKKILFAIIAMFCFGFGNAQTADSIINKHIDAIGGKDAWMKVNSMRMEGTMKVQGADITVKITVLNGKGTRQDITFGGMSGYMIVTPTAGWNFMPFQGQKQPDPITADDLKEAQSELDAQGTLLNYKEKGHSVEYIGTEDIDGVDAYKLKETLKDGKVQTIYIDPKNYYIIREVSKIKANGQEMDQTQNMSNFQKQPSGITIPMSMSTGFGGDLTITKVEVNVPVDEAIFKPGK
jgi:hypothetical protein